ncbi:hypothetical protein I7I51_02206 [Histoplasma capsulatum]|uniref:Uncharacterized protein n=1 Tax=Ajellomyces capsulatus TaxID=5037 RepID=A0A8A1M931_AJECA|nr:hypothetical protein I7I51_02206 [Histoplasma capsulatum]
MNPEWYVVFTVDSISTLSLPVIVYFSLQTPFPLRLLGCCVHRMTGPVTARDMAMGHTFRQ